METWDAISARRNVRQYEDRPIPDEVLNRILEAGRRAPSSGNRQAWDFVVVTEKDSLQSLSEVWRGAGHVARSTVTIALVAPEEDDARTRESMQFDLGQAAMSIILAATDAGVGTGHASVRERDKASEILGLPPDRYCAWLIALGYPDDEPLRPMKAHNRRPFDEVVHRERW